MKALTLSKIHDDILNQPGHLLVTGGPGSGKTTIALLKARHRTKTMLPGEEILFLSFSRAAVHQILKKSRAFLTAAERSLIRVQTYHSFCIEVLRAHGRLLAGRACTFVMPGDERLRKSKCQQDWEVERADLALNESAYCFDLLASAVADLFERSAAVRSLYGASFPLVIVDEFQDTDDDQWRIVRTLSRVANIVCLADADQRIFEYRKNVDPRRLEYLRQELTPTEFDLGTDNHRSPNAGILQFADALLANRSPLPKTEDVKFVLYRGRDFPGMVHAATIWTFGEVRRRGVADPTIAVLARTNPLIAELSGIIRQEHTVNGRRLLPIAHDVVWDAELSAAAAAVVASVMEWNDVDTATLARTLALISHYFHLRNAEQPSQAAAKLAQQFDDSSSCVLDGKDPKYKAARLVRDSFHSGMPMAGDPVADWRKARKLLEDVEPLNSLFRDASLVRLFGARDTLATGLAQQWISHGRYERASMVVKTILDQERLISAERTAVGCILMTMHKSKGKEFDGVVLVEGAYKSQFFETDPEEYPYEKSRRLLRVAITRASKIVMIVRPHNALPLVS